MQVLLSTDNHIHGGANLTSYVESVVQGTLERLGDRVTRVEVSLTDESSAAKDTQIDKRCTMEARLAGRAPIVVRHEGATIEQAVEGAAEKLERTIDRKLGKLEDPKGRVPFSG